MKLIQENHVNTNLFNTLTLQNFDLKEIEKVAITQYKFLKLQTY